MLTFNKNPLLFFLIIDKGKLSADRTWKTTSYANKISGWINALRLRKLIWSSFRITYRLVRDVAAHGFICKKLINSKNLFLYKHRRTLKKWHWTKSICKCMFVCACVRTRILNPTFIDSICKNRKRDARSAISCSAHVSTSISNKSWYQLSSNTKRNFSVYTYPIIEIVVALNVHHVPLVHHYCSRHFIDWLIHAAQRLPSMTLYWWLWSPIQTNIQSILLQIFFSYHQINNSFF